MTGTSHVEGETLTKDKASPAVAIWTVNPQVAKLADGVCPGAVLLTPEEGDRINEILSGDPSSRIVLLSLHPEYAVGAALQAGDALQQALDYWANGAREVLRINRRSRRQVRIVDAHQLRSHTARFVAEFGVKTAKASESQETVDMDPMLLLIAQKALREDQEMATLAGELEASMLNLSDVVGPDGADAGTVLSRYRQLQIDLENRLAAGEQEKAALQAKLDQATSAEARARQEASLVARGEVEQKVLLGQIGELSEALKSSESRLAQFKQKLAAANHEKGRLTAELELVSTTLREVRKSKSYRLMAPLRKVRAMMPPRKT